MRFKKKERIYFAIISHRKCFLIVAVCLSITTSWKIDHKNSLLLYTVTSTTNERDIHNSHRQGPFQMPLRQDEKFEIFQPFYDMDEHKKDKPLLASPQEFIQTFEERISWVNTMVLSPDKTTELKDMSAKEHATYMYLEMIKSFVSAIVFNDAELSVKGNLDGGSDLPVLKLGMHARDGGKDWTYAGDTMIGLKRIDNILQILKLVIQNNVHGDYLEAGA